MSQQMLITLRILNSIIALFNILGNSFLIYALKKTGQTTTFSLQLIILMSTSDLATGIVALSLTNALLWRDYDLHCQVNTATQFMHVAFAGFSFSAVLLIAIDRFLHMKYLQRYPLIITKRRAYSMVIFVFSIYLLAAAAFSLPAAHEQIEFLQLGFFLTCIPILVATAILYSKAITITRRISALNTTLTQNPNIQSKKILKAAKFIIVGSSVLTTPLIICHIILAIRKHQKVTISLRMVTAKWFAYIIALGNGVCSCSIFILQNRPARLMLISMLHKLMRCARREKMELPSAD